MLETLLISNVILWIVVAILGVTVYALARQVGVLYERIAPAGALMISQGPEVGDEAPVFDLQTLDGQDITLGGASDSGRSSLLFFLSPTCATPYCPSCGRLRSRRNLGWMWCWRVTAILSSRLNS